MLQFRSSDHEPVAPEKYDNCFYYSCSARYIETYWRTQITKYPGTYTCTNGLLRLHGSQLRPYLISRIKQLCIGFIDRPLNQESQDHQAQHLPPYPLILQGLNFYSAVMGSLLEAVLPFQMRGISPLNFTDQSPKSRAEFESMATKLLKAKIPIPAI